MKLRSVNLARSLWFCHIREFNPKGLNLYPIIIPLLVKSYGFKKFPSEINDLDETKGILFEGGEFLNSEGDPIIINLAIYTDGLVADTLSSTKDSDAFLEEILTRLHEEFDLPHYEKIIGRNAYISQLFVSTEKSLELINPKLKEIASYLSNYTTGFKAPHYEIAGIHIWPDQTEILKPVSFVFERMLNIPFSEKKYYSVAPLATDKHLKLLEMIEDILSK